jgi:hypothetical protein
MSSTFRTPFALDNGGTVSVISLVVCVGRPTKPGSRSAYHQHSAQPIVPVASAASWELNTRVSSSVVGRMTVRDLCSIRSILET